MIYRQEVAVVFFCRHLLSPIASIFGSGAPCAARTFLSCGCTSDRPGHCFPLAKLRKKTDKGIQFGKINENGGHFYGQERLSRHWMNHDLLMVSHIIAVRPKCLYILPHLQHLSHLHIITVRPRGLYTSSNVLGRPVQARWTVEKLLFPGFMVIGLAWSINECKFVALRL